MILLFNLQNLFLRKEPRGSFFYEEKNDER